LTTTKTSGELTAQERVNYNFRLPETSVTFAFFNRIAP